MPEEQKHMGTIQKIGILWEGEKEMCAVVTGGMKWMKHEGHKSA